MKTKQVLVACGAGIATSTVVDNAIEEMVKEYNTKVDIKQIKITEAGPCKDIVDLLITTATIKREYKFPVINTCNFLTGISTEETRQQTLTELQK